EVDFLSLVDMFYCDDEEFDRIFGEVLLRSEIADREWQRRNERKRNTLLVLARMIRLHAPTLRPYLLSLADIPGGASKRIKRFTKVTILLSEVTGGTLYPSEFGRFAVFFDGITKALAQRKRRAKTVDGDTAQEAIDAALLVQPHLE